MWFLYAIKDGQETTRTLLRPGRMYSLGRRDADILPPIVDKSISRKHATLEIAQITTGDWNEIDKKSDVIFRDLNSKCGSSVNSARVEGVSLDQGVYMNDGDTLQIGTKTGKFRLSWQPLTICRQSMPPAEKQKLLNSARSIGAKVTHLIRSPYTHLLMSSIQISFKVARCMAEGKPIITQDWLDALVNLPDSDYTFPPVADYLPSLDASCEGPLGVPDFTPNSGRARLFTGKRFVFFDEKQFEQLSSLIKACNGSSVLFDVNKVDPFKEQLGNDDTIVVRSETLAGNDAWKNIIHALESCQSRTVLDTELCWGILYNSIEVQCNAKYGVLSSTSAHSGPPISNAIENASNGNSASPSSAVHVSTNANEILPPSNVSSSSNIYQERLPRYHETLNQAASSSAGYVSTSANQSPPFSAAPSSAKRKQLPQDHPSPSQASSRPHVESVNMNLDLDDLFDQIVGDEPSRPPPTAQSASPGPSVSQALQTTVNNDRSEYENNNAISPGGLVTEGQTATVGHVDVTKRTINKGKARLHESESLIDNEAILSVDNDVESSSTVRKSKKSRTGNNTNSSAPPATPRKPFVLPELENENADITSGKNYTKVIYSALVVAPSPPENWTTRQQRQAPGEINYKKFKKVIHPSPVDPLFTVGMVAGDYSDTVELGSVPEIVDDDFSDVRILPNAKRGMMWR